MNEKEEQKLREDAAKRYIKIDEKKSEEEMGKVEIYMHKHKVAVTFELLVFGSLMIYLLYYIWRFQILG